LSNIEPTPFGEKYVLVEHIATGGMAEIYRANYAGIEGFAKELVVKMLRDEFVTRPAVVEMFLDEARMAATLTHNNVVHTYDLGEIEGDYYIAMEFLRGEELVNVLRRAVQTGQMIPRDLAIGIIMQSLEGLHYVHQKRGEDGQPLGLVHRDINPTNIHVGYDGVAKILDFGIAATRASLVAKQGEFAGKLSYMGPEQISGHEIDHRADIFAIGVILYEMCLGRRLFRGRRDDVVRRIQDGDIPAPTFVDPSFPPALEAILMKALEVDPAERYQNCDHMFRDLEAFLQEERMGWTPRKISAFMEALFGEGAPAEVDYDDLYDDLVDEALDFDAFDTFGGDESAPEWVKDVEGAAAGEPSRRRIAIGNLEQLVTDTGAFRTDGSGPRRVARQKDPERRSKRHKVVPTGKRPPTGKRGRTTGVQDVAHRDSTRSRAAILTTGSQTAVGQERSGLNGGFGHGVVQEQGKKGAAALGWILGVVGVLALLYFAWSAFTAK